MEIRRCGANTQNPKEDPRDILVCEDDPQETAVEWDEEGRLVISVRAGKPTASGEWITKVSLNAQDREKLLRELLRRGEAAEQAAAQ
jgi:hypothetical protein